MVTVRYGDDTLLSRKRLLERGEEGEGEEGEVKDLGKAVARSYLSLYFHFLMQTNRRSLTCIPPLSCD